MPRIKYVTKRFRPETLSMIDQVNEIVEEYTADGYDLTLRQLYYQFVARGLIENTDREYKRIGSIVNDGRLAGLIDWEHIVDRTRNLRKNSHWDSPQEIVRASSSQFEFDKWEDQPFRPEVWIEKDALIGVIEEICENLDVPYFSCRGYTSQSEMWSASQRLGIYSDNSQTPCILHLGDHDPSGIDMTRDIFDRLDLFMGDIEVKRLALNFDQVEVYSPPPNPAKITDSRAAGYIKKHGDESWELDALEPRVIARLIHDTIEKIRDDDLWDAQIEREQEARDKLCSIADRMDEEEDDD